MCGLNTEEGMKDRFGVTHNDRIYSPLTNKASSIQNRIQFTECGATIVTECKGKTSQTISNVGNGWFESTRCHIQVLAWIIGRGCQICSKLFSQSVIVYSVKLILLKFID